MPTENASVICAPGDSPDVAERTKINGSRLDTSSTNANEEHSMVIGTRNYVMLKARSGRFAKIFVSRLDPRISESELSHYIKRTDNVITKCTQLETKYDMCASFTSPKDGLQVDTSGHSSLTKQTMAVHLASYNCNGFKSFEPYLYELPTKCDILCLQELMQEYILLKMSPRFLWSWCISYGC